MTRADVPGAPAPAAPGPEWSPGLRSLAWRGYLAYQRWAPVNRGKWRLAKLIESRLGPASVNLRGLSLELLPYAYLDGHLLAEGSFEPEIEALVGGELGPGDIFVDIGANIGWFTLLAAARGATVHAFEPFSESLTRLARHVSLNRFSSIQIHPIALGARNETLSLAVAGEGNPGANSLVNASRSFGRVEVPVRTLAGELTAAEARRVKLVKIDVEGWELEVLRGAQALAPHLRNAVFVVEVTPAWLRQAGGSAEELYGLLHSWGFEPVTGPLDEWQYTEVFRHPEQRRGVD